MEQIVVVVHRLLNCVVVRCWQLLGEVVCCRLRLFVVVVVEGVRCCFVVVV